MRTLTASRRTTGRPIYQRRGLKTKTRRRWTWRSLFHPPIPQLVALLLVLGGVYALATSHVFAVSTVQVVGDDGLPVDELRASCACLGKNIFLTRPDQIRARLSRIAWLDVRQVYARLPDRIVIDAAYRRPVVLWRTTAATYTVDASGTVLYDLGAPPVPPDLVPATATTPIVFDATVGALDSGRQVSSIAVQMVRATHQYLARDIAITVNRFRWSPYSGMTAHSRIGWWFTLGVHLGADLQIRLAALESAYHDKYMHLNHCNFVDLEPLPNIYCRFEPQWLGPWGPGTH